MSISRRNLLGAGAIAGIIAGISFPKTLLGEIAPRTPVERPDGLPFLAMHHFQGQVGTAFDASRGYAHMTLELDSVTDLSAPPRAGEPEMRGEAFLLRFSAPLDQNFSQDVYRLEQRRLGTMSLLLVPGGAGDKGLVYEAVINRRTPSASGVRTVNRG